MKTYAIRAGIVLFGGFFILASIALLILSVATADVMWAAVSGFNIAALSAMCSELWHWAARR